MIRQKEKEDECIEQKLPQFGEIWSFDHNIDDIRNILGGKPVGRYITSRPYRYVGGSIERLFVNLYSMDTSDFDDNEEYVIELKTFLRYFKFEPQDEV